MNRDSRQDGVHAWCVSAFGKEHSENVEQRALRLVEEAIEAAQACGCDLAMLHKLVDYVYSRPVGKIEQELGGVGLTTLALAAAAGLSADDLEAREFRRVLATPLQTFSERNKQKNEAGFQANSAKESDHAD